MIIKDIISGIEGFIFQQGHILARILDEDHTKPFPLIDRTSMRSQKTYTVLEQVKNN